MLYSSKVTGVFYIWYQSEVETLGPIGLRNAPACFVLNNDWIFLCDPENQQVRTIRLIQVP